MLISEARQAGTRRYKKEKEKALRCFASRALPFAPVRFREYLPSKHGLTIWTSIVDFRFLHLSFIRAINGTGGRQLPFKQVIDDCAFLVEVNANASDDANPFASAPVAWMTSLNCLNPCITHSCKPLWGLVYTRPFWFLKPLLIVSFICPKDPARCNMFLDAKLSTLAMPNSPTHIQRFRKSGTCSIQCSCDSALYIAIDGIGSPATTFHGLISVLKSFSHQGRSPTNRFYCIWSEGFWVSLVFSMCVPRPLAV